MFAPSLPHLFPYLDSLISFFSDFLWRGTSDSGSYENYDAIFYTVVQLGVVQCTMKSFYCWNILSVT